MLSLTGKNIYLRALEKVDLEFLYGLENDTEFWEISGTVVPYSRDVLSLYLEHAHRDIYDVKQLRLVICNKDHASIGLIDLFDFDPQNHRAGIGIVIKEDSNRNNGVGAEAVHMICNYAVKTLALKQVYANILIDNTNSIFLFKKLGFEQVGIKRNWIYTDGAYKDEILFQKILR